MTDQDSYSIREDLRDDLIDMRLDRMLHRLDFLDHGTSVPLTNSAGVNPAETFTRTGTIRYLLHPGIRELNIRSKGFVEPRHTQENGGETHCKSMFFFNEQVRHGSLSPNPPVTPGQVWDFAGTNSFSEDNTGAIVSGGHNYDSTTTQANADINITASNTFIIGKESSEVRHHLFYGCPCDTHDPGFRLNAKRAGARGMISAIRELNGQTLHSFTIPQTMHNNKKLQIVPLQKILR
ncbi:MAG: hypothetical protein ABL996_24845, partial [Micropepsaceae bacterium]